MKNLIMQRHPMLEPGNTWLADEPKWYVLYVKSGELQKVTNELNKQGVFTYQARSRHENNRGETIRGGSIFPKNLFIHLSRKNLMSIPCTKERISFVHNYDTPAFITDEELEGIHSFLKKNSDVMVSREGKMAVGLEGDNFSRNYMLDRSGAAPQMYISSLACTLTGAVVEEVSPRIRFASVRKSIGTRINVLMFHLFNKPSARVE